MADTKTIRQSVLIPAPPRAVYDALAKPARHAKFTGQAATFTPKAGGAFTAYGGYIRGINLQLKPGKRLVQAWWSQGWKDGAYSIVTYEFAKMAGGGTKIEFTQIGVPANDYAAKSKGWHEHYWNPLIAMFKAEAAH